MNIFEYKTHIQFCDIDEFNKLSMKGLIRILGEVAGIHSELVGYGLSHVPITHLGWMLLNWKAKIISAPSWNTELKIKTWARDFSRIGSNRDFEVYDSNDNLVAIASSKWVLINMDTMKIARLTPEISNCYGQYEKKVFEEEVNEKIEESENSKLTFEYKISQRDIDTNHHVNNLYYIDYAMDSLPKNINFSDFKNLEIVYKKQFKKDDEILCYYDFDGNTKKHIITIKDKNKGDLHTLIRLF